MALMMKLNLVNKHEYEEQENYREIVLRIPKETVELERDFRYLGLDYKNLSIQDTNILDCEIIDRTDSNFSTEISKEISNIIIRANESGFTTPYQDIKKMLSIIDTLKCDDKYKLLAVLENKREDISNIRDAIKFANNIDCFELFEVDDEEELARKLVYDLEIDIEDLMEYADLQRLGEDISEEQKIAKTNHGYLRQNEEIRLSRTQEEEEEFE